NVPADARWVEGDLRDAGFVASLWGEGRFDYVYHLGAYAAEGLSHFIRAYNYRTNLEASVNLINQAVLGDCGRFVFTSSIPVFGDGRQTRAFSHIVDVAPIIARAPLVEASRNEVYNIGADQPYTILELAEEIAGAFGVDAVLEHLPARNEVVHAFSDHTKV